METPRAYASTPRGLRFFHMILLSHYVLLRFATSPFDLWKQLASISNFVKKWTTILERAKISQKMPQSFYCSFQVGYNFQICRSAIEDVVTADEDEILITQIQRGVDRN